MKAIKLCKLEGCEELVPFSSSKYCTLKHRRRADYLRLKQQGYWDKRFAEIKKQYRQSGVNKEGISLHAWMRMPKGFK